VPPYAQGLLILLQSWPLCLPLLLLQVGKDALSTWQATIAAQFSDVGFAPSGVMLSAYGYFDGTVGARDNTASRGGRQSISSTLSRAGGGPNGRQAVQYSAFGAAVTEVELDMLTGERRVLATDIAYDCGYSLNPRIDLGQVEGAFVMGEEGGGVTEPEGLFDNV